jgi:hypothetical protein
MNSEFSTTATTYGHIDWLPQELAIVIILLIILTILITILITKRVNFVGLFFSRFKKKKESKPAKGSTAPIITTQEVQLPEYSSLPIEKKGLLDE